MALAGTFACGIALRYEVKNLLNMQEGDLRILNFGGPRKKQQEEA